MHDLTFIPGSCLLHIVLLQSVARDIMLRLKDTQPEAGSGGGSGPSLRVGTGQRKATASKQGGCC